MFVTKLKALTVATIVLGAIGLGAGRLTHFALAEGPQVVEHAQRKDQTDAEQQAAHDLAVAKVALTQAQADLEVAKAQVAQREAVYRAASQRSDQLSDKKEPAAAVVAMAKRFKYRVPVETGLTEFKDGGHIEILEIWGTRPQIEVGGLYVVRGKYALPSHEHGTIYFYETASSGPGTGPTLDLQFTTVQKGKGEFTLMHTMAGPGYFHVQLLGSDQERQTSVANVYFGSGENILRKW